ncbi:hypothetical protein N0B51_05195 [Tsuneonella sp. YG55]|uniref:Uncharacterized protein n=1 Tax=Tsuneonella litorea TaxID=2976475 RepID=A0A9X2W1T4_9SPHN|nr:hypothetical protein [Tsuneonella litorea]MCT2558371.1 hypothetical protein [Tsuneonella litorea]
MTTELDTLFARRQLRLNRKKILALVAFGLPATALAVAGATVALMGGL